MGNATNWNCYLILFNIQLVLEVKKQVNLINLKWNFLHSKNFLSEQPFVVWQRREK